MCCSSNGKHTTSKWRHLAGSWIYYNWFGGKGSERGYLKQETDEITREVSTDKEQGMEGEGRGGEGKELKNPGT